MTEKKNKVMCELCEKVKAEVKHHVIPRMVIKKVNKKSKAMNKTINLCKPCELECHYGFLTYLIMAQKYDGYNRFHAIKYVILKNYLKNKCNPAWKKFEKWFKNFLNHTLSEFKLGELRADDKNK